MAKHYDFFFHLVIEPGLLIAAVLVCDGFVLGADVLQHSVEVLLGRGVHLHVDSAGELRAQSRQLLHGRERKRESSALWRSFSFFFDASGFDKDVRSPRRGSS